MFPFLNIGPLALPTKPLLVIAGIYLIQWVVERLAVRMSVPVVLASEWVFRTVIAGFVGARAVFVIEQWDIYLRNPWGIVWPVTAGYAVWAGWLAAGGMWLWFGYQREQNLWRAADLFMPALLIFFCALRLGDLFGGPGFGAVTDLFGLNRHLVQLYDVVVALIVLVIWWAGQAQRRWDGWLFLVTTVMFTFGLTLTLPFRGDPILIGNGWLLGQVVMIGVMTAACAGLAYFSVEG